IFLGVTGACAVVLGAPFIISRLFGSEFDDAIGVTMALLPGVLAVSVSRAIAPAVVRFGRLWTQSIFSVAALTLNVVFNVVLDPGLGAVGAALASTVSYGLGCVLAVAWLRVRLG